MDFVAIVERRLLHWYVYIPALAAGGSVPEPNDVQAYAAALVTAATGRAPADVRISLHLAAQADSVLRTPPTEVEARHQDGTWRVAQHIGWLRRRDGSWQPLVSYASDGVAWQRAVHASRFRPREGGVPAPRTSAEEGVGAVAPSGSPAPARTPRTTVP